MNISYRKDVVSSVILFLFGIVVIFESLRMPRFDGGFFLSPGMFPMVIAFAMILCSVWLFTTAYPKAKKTPGSNGLFSQREVKKLSRRLPAVQILKNSSVKDLEKLRI